MILYLILYIILIFYRVAYYTCFCTFYNQPKIKKKNMQKLVENLASCQTNTRSQKRRLKYAFSPTSIPQAIVNSNFPAWKIFSKIMARISNQFSSDQEPMHNETFPKKDYITFLIVRILQNAQNNPKHIWSKQLNQMMRKELDFPPEVGAIVTREINFELP